MRLDNLSISAKGDYSIREDIHAKTTRLILKDIGGEHLVGTYPWAVYGRQGAYEAAYRTLKQASDHIDVFTP